MSTRRVVDVIAEHELDKAHHRSLNYNLQVNTTIILRFARLLLTNS